MLEAPARRPLLCKYAAAPNYSQIVNVIGAEAGVPVSRSLVEGRQVLLKKWFFYEI